MLAIFLDFKQAYDCIDRRFLYNVIKERWVNFKYY